MLAFDVTGGIEGARRFSNGSSSSRSRPRRFRRTTADTPWLTSHRHVAPEKKRALGIQEGTIRLSVGAEAFEDLREDIEGALGRET